MDNLQAPKMLKVKLKNSKTDPLRRGVDVYVGRTEDDLCPVTAVLTYMAARGKGPGPFFKFRDGSPLRNPDSWLK